MATIMDFLTNNADKIKAGITSADVISAKYTYSNVHTLGTFSDLEFVTDPKPYKRYSTTGTTYGVDSNGFDFFKTPTHPELYALDVNGFRFKLSADADVAGDLIIGTDIKYLFEFNSTDKNGIVIPEDVALISKMSVTDNDITEIADNASNISTKYVLKANNKYYTVTSGTLTEIQETDVMTNGFDSTETGFSVSSLGSDVQLIIIASMDDSNPSAFDFTLSYGINEVTVTGGTRSEIAEFINFYLIRTDGMDVYELLADHTVQNGVLNSDLYADADLYALNPALPYGKALTSNTNLSNLFVKVPTYDDFDTYVPDNDTFTNVYSIISEGQDNPNYATDDKVTGSQDSIKKYQATGTITTGTNFRPMLTLVYTSTLGKAYGNAGRAEDLFWYNGDVATTVTKTDVATDITKYPKYELPMIKLGGVDGATVNYAARVPSTNTSLFGLTEVGEFFFKFWINNEQAELMTTAYTEFIFGDSAGASSAAVITLKVARDSLIISGTNPVFTKTVTFTSALEAGELLLHVRAKDAANAVTALVEISQNGDTLATVSESADGINFTSKFICRSIAYVNGTGDTSYSLLSELLFFEDEITKNYHMIPLGKDTVYTDPSSTWTSTTVGDQELYTTSNLGPQYLYHDIDTTNLDDAAAKAMELNVVGMVVSTAGHVDTTDHTQVGHYTTNIRNTAHTITRKYAKKEIGADSGSWTFREDPITRDPVTKTTLNALEIGTETVPED